MTEKAILGLVQTLNKGSNDLIVLTKLSEQVDYGKVWQHVMVFNSLTKLSGPYSIYFIKNFEGHYIGAILDMTVDLHWCILPQFRGQSCMSVALRSIILPHIFQSRPEIWITINKNEKNNKKPSGI